MDKGPGNIEYVKVDDFTRISMLEDHFGEYTVRVRSYGNTTDYQCLDEQEARGIFNRLLSAFRRHRQEVEGE